MKADDKALPIDHIDIGYMVLKNPLFRMRFTL